MTDSQQANPNGDTGEGLSRRALIGGAAAGGLAFAAGVLSNGASTAAAAPLGAVTRVSLTFDDVEIASFPELVDLVVALDPVSTAEGNSRVPTALPPKVVLRRPFDSDEQMWAWFEAARQGAPNGRRSCSLTLFRSSTPVTKFFLNNAWPTSLDVAEADRGSALEETVTLTCEFIQRVAV